MFVPDLPNTDHPDFKEQLSFLEKNYKDLIDENTIIVGHSLGCFLAKQFIVKCNKKIKKFISVAPVHDELIIDDEDVNRYIKDITTDTKKLNKLVGETFLFISQNDPLIPHEAAKTYYEKSFKDAKIVSFQDK
ncbi:alpha/beta hydrolase [Patescibacteria group bacterium]|nr:alpha/beta hydrolase [Patescibacteria group bacterium]MBU1757768.1 alpha/beta hydrolase [Patescibacteria group bacterium]